MTIHRGAGRLHGFAIVAPAVGLAMGGTLVSGLVARPATFALGPAAPQDDSVGYNQALDSAAGARERRSDLPEAAGLRHLRQPCTMNTQAVFRAAR